MQDALRTYLALATGLTDVSRKKAKAAARKFAKQGGATVEQIQALTEDLLATSLANRESLTTLIRYEVDRALGVVGLATAEEVESLTLRIRELQEELATRDAAANARPAPSTVAATRAPAKKAVAKKAVAKKAVAKKAVAKKAVAKKAVAKRAPAKRAVPTS